MNMTIESLKTRLNAIAWEEQMDFEASEREGGAEVSAATQAARLQELAGALTPVQLDELERAPGYAVWALRLAPFVAGDDTRTRAMRWIAHADHDVRHWAARLRSGS